MTQCNTQLTLNDILKTAVVIDFDGGNITTDTLRSDPAFRIAVGCRPETDDDLARQPTITRFENAVTYREIKRINNELLNLYLVDRSMLQETIAGTELQNAQMTRYD